MEESLARMLVCSVMLPACARGRYTTPYAIVAFVIFLHLTELNTQHQQQSLTQKERC